VSIDAALDGERLRLEIADDGVGGADETAGSGLSGLRDRVHAVGGELWVDSPPGGGTPSCPPPRATRVAYATRLLGDRAGRIGYLLKDHVVDVAALTSALRRVHAGETVVDAGLVRALVDAPRADDPLEPLTAREREVLALIAEGRTDRGIIAAALVVSPRPSRRMCAASSPSLTCRRRRPRTAASTRSLAFLQR
jgi:hypothetical protein